MVGLGNPGAKYAFTRHNAGSECVEFLAETTGVRLRKSVKYQALVAQAQLGQFSLFLAFPQTFMNESGRSVKRLVSNSGIKDLQNLIVIHDELDLPVGRLKIKQGGGTAGHNGLKSIGEHLKDLSFIRLRIGIGRPQGEGDIAKYVLQPPKGEQRLLLQQTKPKAVSAIEMILEQGLPAAMNVFNTN